ncbi:hypothetical protein BS78_05G025500 [Paspalum vaginatum]|nr:hypothetical protein BS78_05G025500 [Paspalum vaginatum]
MFEAFADKNLGQHGMPYMRETISNNLVGKKFFLVLDDVWTESRLDWEDFWEFLITTGAHGSRILLTTRSSKVTEIVGSTDPFQLPLLSKSSSWQLFLESYERAGNGLDHKFFKVGKDIVEKCGGVPLAIKVLVGVLYDKELIEEWEAMRDSNVLDVEGEEHRVFECLRWSYFHLPSHLKQCFTICSVFPKGHMLDKEQLIDQWIAHDIIVTMPGVDCLEYIGHKHFSSLVQVSFLQDVEEKYGRVKCRMHDLVHDLARSILREEISTNMPKDATSSTKGYRYFSFIEQPRTLFPRKVFRNVRAIYADEGNHVIFGKALKNTKHLRSIVVNHILSTTVLTAIFQIKNLKYLEMSLLQCKALPEAISNIWSLQAVHLTYSGLLELPKSIGKLHKLRTLNLSNSQKLKCLPDSIGNCNTLSSTVLCYCMKLIALPKSIGKLHNLRTLNLSRCKGLKCLPDSIGDCDMLSSIDLCNCEKLTALPNSIGKNEKLRVLRLGYTKIKNLPSSTTTLRNLECLDLHCCWELVELPEGMGNLEKLQVLNLEYCQWLVELPECISNLEKLHVLNLKHCWNLVKLPKGISKLDKIQVLNLKGCTDLVELPEGIGKFEKLQVLTLENCEELRGMPVGIGQLSQLQKLDLFVVGYGEKFAGISELANVGINSKDLVIRGIANVLEQDHAHKACLKQKTNLQRLNLEWKTHHKGEVNPELEEAILDGLEPPPGIKGLEIYGYSGRKYAWWMQKRNQVGGEVEGLAYFQFLTVMKLHGFPNLNHLHGLVELPCLEELVMQNMPSLESISGGPFRSLVKLIMEDLPRLEEVWLVAERTMFDGEEGGSCSNWAPHFEQVQVGDCVTSLEILDCAKLKMRTFLPLSGHLKHWQLLGGTHGCQCHSKKSNSTFGHSHLKKIGNEWELLQYVGVLESLDILFFDGLRALPGSLGNLAFLRSLHVFYCSTIRELPECLGELRSLQELFILGCESLSSLPQSMGHLTSLQVLHIIWCFALQQLPESLGGLCSLWILHVGGFPNINSFPQSMQHLTSLEDLELHGCDALHELPEWLGDLHSLRKLEINGLVGLACFPKSMCQLTSLKELRIGGCPRLTSLPLGMESLTSLEKLSIFRFQAIESLPEGINGLTALKELEIDDCPGVVSLPEGMQDVTSLEKLKISSCPGIKSLPGGIKCLTALKELKISDCPDLERRCDEGKGEDWHLICHILPCVSII